MKSWIKIMTLNAVFFLAFLLGFLYEGNDPMQFISTTELAFLIIPIPFAIFCGFYSFKQTQNVFVPEMIFSLAMISFSLWVDYKTNLGVGIEIGVLCCLATFTSAIITFFSKKHGKVLEDVLNYTENCEKYENFSNDFKEFIYWCISDAKQAGFARARGDVPYEKIMRKIKGEELEMAKEIVKQKLARSHEVFYVKILEYCNDVTAISLIESTKVFYKNKNTKWKYEIDVCNKALKRLKHNSK